VIVRFKKNNFNIKHYYDPKNLKEIENRFEINQSHV